MKTIPEKPSRQVGKVDENSAPANLYHSHKHCKTGSRIILKEPLSQVEKTSCQAKHRHTHTAATVQSTAFVSNSPERSFLVLYLTQDSKHPPDHCLGATARCNQLHSLLSTSVVTERSGGEESQKNGELLNIFSTGSRTRMARKERSAPSPVSVSPPHFTCASLLCLFCYMSPQNTVFSANGGSIFCPI